MLSFIFNLVKPLHPMFPFESWALNFFSLWFIAVVVSHVISKFFGPGFNVKGKHVLLTGGSTGLGKALAIRYAKAGAHVTIVARTQSKLEDAVKEIQSELDEVDRKKVQFVACDVTDDVQLVSSIDSACKAFNQTVDILVCSAGSAKPGFFEDLTLDDHRQQLELNYIGTLAAIKAVYPSMAEKKSGHVVLISSAICFAGMTGYSAYAPSKFALRGLADCLRSEFQALNIKVSIYFPANIETPGFEEENKIKPKETAQIEGSSSACTPGEAADVLINGIAKGHYGITNNFDSALGMIASRGVAPPNNVFLEALISPIIAFVAVFFTRDADAVAIKAKLGLIKKTK